MDVESICAMADKQIQLGDEGLKNFRLGHLKLFKDQGYSSTKRDEYKFTSLEKFFSGLAYEPKTSEQDDSILEQTDFPTLVFLDGVVQRNLSLGPGIKVSPLKGHFPELITRLKDHNGISHLHHSLMEEGVIIEITRNQEVSAPLRIVHMTTMSAMSAPTIFIIARESSKITIIEESLGEQIPYAQVNETYITAHPGAKVEHIQLHQGSTQGIHHGSVYAEIDKDASVTSFIFHTSGKMIRNNLHLSLNAAGANAQSYALFLTHQSEHSDINTTIAHKAADTTSTQIAKGIMDGESKAVFTGLIHIYPDSQRVASSQINKNLLLSKKAQIHSQPQLEIFADDVKCSHGSTTGALSDEEVFYFQTRGIPADKARTLLAHGFGMEVVQRINNKPACRRVSSVILGHLETKFNLGGKS